MLNKSSEIDSHLKFFRSATRYINAFRNKIFVVAFGGELFQHEKFKLLIEDINLLASLGIRLVLVHGARPQIDERLKLKKLKHRYHNGIRITDQFALECVKESVGALRVELEGLLSIGLPNSSFENADLSVVSGNYVTAKPLGVRNGIDYLYTGEVRKIDIYPIQRHLDQGELVLLSCLGYSLTGEVFNLTFEDVATQVAIGLNAEKLIFLSMEDLESKELTLKEAESILRQKNQLTEDLRYYLPRAIQAVKNNQVQRVHLVYILDLLAELFTDEGQGILVTQNTLDHIRSAKIKDIKSIMNILEPLEKAGILIKRSRQRLEHEIDNFYVKQHDNKIIGCVAFYPYEDEKTAELACLALSQSSTQGKHGDSLLKWIESLAKSKGLNSLFVLTTRTAHWFIEHGFQERSLDHLPNKKKSNYDQSRKSKVLFKDL